MHVRYVISRKGGIKEGGFYVADLDDTTNKREGGREEGRESVGGMESEKTTMARRKTT